MKVYMLESELFLSKVAEQDLAIENEELKQEKCNADKLRSRKQGVLKRGSEARGDMCWKRFNGRRRQLIQFC